MADTGTFTAANNTVMWNEGSSGIPSGWTRVNQCNIVDLTTLTGDYEAKNGDVLINTLADNYKISVADGATVTLRNAEIKGDYFASGMEAGINCQGDATILFEGTNIVVGRSDWPGIYVPSGKTLTISGDGNLTATGNSGAAGIGGRNSEDCGNIIISEGTGTITAISNSYGAGIGSSYKGTCGTIEIASTFTGTVNATSNDGGGVGIGSGNKGTSSSITINGGTVKATGSVGGAGIGSGSDGSCGSITITDGVTSVTATKGSSAPNSIGKGSYAASCGTVTIGGVEGAITESPYTYPAPATGHALASSVVGEIVGTDGLAYDVADKDNLPTGVTVVAMVAYKDGSNGLAIQLNANPSLMDWDSANLYTGYPAVSGGVATWRLPSMDDWQNMFVGCAKSGDAEKSNYMDPIAGFKEKIAATGIAFDSNGYWSPSGTYSWAVDVNLYDTYATASFSSTPGYYNKYVLGCLAF